MTSLVTPVSYLNTSGSPVPPHGCIDLLGDCDVASGTQVISVKAATPGSGSGIYAIDSGKGTGDGGSTAYGQFFIPSSAPVWAYYLGESAPGTAWVQEVGPYTGGFDLVTAGTGFIYAGVFDAANERILVISKSATTDSGGGGGGTGGGGCSCCDCTRCLDMCSQGSDEVIKACSKCAVAPKSFIVNLGSVLGVQTFVYDSGCTWKTNGFSVYYTYPTGAGGSISGVYVGTFVEAGASSTLTVTHSSGPDPLKLLTARKLAWKADPDKSWSCICNMTMIPSVPPESFPPNLFVPCEACVAPADSPPLGSGCSYLDGNCIPYISFDGVIPPVDMRPSCPPGNTCECRPAGTPYEYYTTLVSAEMRSRAGSPCCFDSTGYLQGTSQTQLDGNQLCSAFMPGIGGGVSYKYWITTASVCVDSSGHFTLTISSTTGVPAGTASWSYAATYKLNSHWVLGVNTLTYDSSFAVFSDSYTGTIGSITDGTWPATTDVVVTPCTFGDINADYGYGCGGVDLNCDCHGSVGWKYHAESAYWENIAGSCGSLTGHACESLAPTWAGTEGQLVFVDCTCP